MLVVVQEPAVGGKSFQSRGWLWMDLIGLYQVDGWMDGWTDESHRIKWEWTWSLTKWEANGIIIDW